MGVFEGKFPQWAYLIAYNAISALLWTFIFGRTVAVAAGNGLSEAYLYPSVRITLLLTQSLAALDILHSIIGTFSPHHLPGPPLTDRQVSSMLLSSPASCKLLAGAQSSGSSLRTTSPLASVLSTAPWFSRGAQPIPFAICTSLRDSSVATSTVT